MAPERIPAENDVVGELAARATQLLGNAQTQQSRLAGLQPEFLVDPTLGNVAAVVRLELFVKEAAHRVTELLVLFGITITAHEFPLCRLGQRDGVK
jgi:hypothetical protein